MGSKEEQEDAWKNEWERFLSSKILLLEESYFVSLMC